MNVAFRSSRERRSLPGFEPVAAPQLFHIEPHGKYANCDQADVKQRGDQRDTSALTTASNKDTASKAAPAAANQIGTARVPAVSTFRHHLPS
jgi:hypothetical protein